MTTVRIFNEEMMKPNKADADMLEIPYAALKRLDLKIKVQPGESMSKLQVARNISALWMSNGEGHFRAMKAAQEVFKDPLEEIEELTTKA